MGGAAATAKQAAASKVPKDTNVERSVSNAAEKLPGKAGQTVSFDPKDVRPPSATTVGAQRSANTNPESIAGGTTSSSLHVNRRLSGPADHGSASGISGSGNTRTRLAELDETDAEEAMQKAMEEAEKRPNAIILDACLADGEPSRFREVGPAANQQPLPKETQTDPEVVGTTEAGNRWPVHSSRWSRVQSARYGLLPRDPEREIRATRGPRLGPGGSAWVDNSDFHSVRTPSRTSEIRLGPDMGPRSPTGNGGSHVVSLPAIPRLPASEQRAIVKDLHEGMDSTSSPDNSPFGTSGLMRDFNLDSPRDHGRHHGSTRGSRYAGGGSRYHHAGSQFAQRHR